jgi:hypothetical protein
MEDKLLFLLLILFLVFIIAFTFYFAKKKELKCRDCGSDQIIRTGNRREIPRSKKPIIGVGLPYEYEYQCKKCGSLFWSPIESFYEF